MPYTHDYYHILGIPSPRAINTTSTPTLDTEFLRSKYREALLRAHPDKQSLPPSNRAQEARTSTHTENQTEGKGDRAYTVDEVREAFAVLSDGSRKREYDMWLRSSASNAVAKKQDEDFILGLEVLDLSDFDEVKSRYVASSTSSPASAAWSRSTPEANTHATPEGEGEGEEKTEWRRPCRCGVAPGFVIPEQELEDAIGRGEDEVLVGCAGCSLWVRVEFGIDETVR